jgi:hypothetical protein
MAELKTKATKVSVKDFLKSVTDTQKRKDSLVLIEMMSKITKEKPKMWGPSIIGFGSYHYKYESGHEGDMCIVGFSPRKAAISIYISAGFKKRDSLLKKLGKHKSAVACLYVRKLEDVDLKILKELITESFKHSKTKKL